MVAAQAWFDADCAMSHAVGTMRLFRAQIGIMKRGCRDKSEKQERGAASEPAHTMAQDMDVGRAGRDQGHGVVGDFSPPSDASSIT